MTIQGLYLSAYQGKITSEAVGRMIAKGVRFVGLRLTQGTGYIDPTWEHNAAMLRDTGILLFPWHFVTADDASKQHLHFLKQIVKFNKWRLPPALDCEAYTSVGTELFTVSEMMMYPGIFSFSKSKIAVSLDGSMIGRYSVYALTYPTEATADAMGRWLTVWMAAQPALASYVYPAIYTNASSGNRIFKTASMKRYPLWVANWSTPGKPPLTAPALPIVWKGTPWYIWQDGIVDGAPYGIDGQVDHDIWGSLFPFPGDEPPPPPPPPVGGVEMTLKRDGQTYSGTLKET